MKIGGESVSGKSARVRKLARSPLPSLIVAACFLLSGCEALNFFLLPSPEETSAESDPDTEPRDESPRAVASVFNDGAGSLEPAISATSTPTDLWVRMRAGFVLGENNDPERVSEALGWFVGKQPYIERVAGRATPYLHYILEQVEQRELPSELALIPVIESGFQPFARSPSGAAGLWQFIASTGKRFGLKQTWWYDGRRDVVAATTAALDYLEYLHKEFHGDWLLAIAAYNAGEGTVRAAIKRNQQAAEDTDYWSLKLPRETRRYIPRLLALARVVQQPGHVDLELPPLANQPYFSRVDPQHQIDLALVSELAGISMDEVYRLNPGFNRWASDPDGPHQLLIPVPSRGSISRRYRAGST